MTTNYRYPIRIELYLKKEGEWALAQTIEVYNKASLYNKFEYFKTMYALTKKDYRIYIIVPSKVNTYAEKGKER